MINGLYPNFEHWSEEGTVWVYSDPHFGNEDMPPEMHRIGDEDQLKLINSGMGKKDTFICLGDVGNIDFVKRIKAGNKILVCGNHDKGASNYKREVITKFFDYYENTKQEVYEQMKQFYPQDKWIITITRYENHSSPLWIAIADNKLFDEVYAGPLMIGEKIILSHEPLNLDWALNLHGHVHNGQYRSDDYHRNFCSDVIDYKPVNFNQFMKEGPLSAIKSIHRSTIDGATQRKKERARK